MGFHQSNRNITNKMENQPLYRDVSWGNSEEDQSMRERKALDFVHHLQKEPKREVTKKLYHSK